MSNHFTATITPGCGHSPPVSAVRVQVMRDGEPLGEVWYDPDAGGYRFTAPCPLDPELYAAALELLARDGLRVVE